MPSGWQTPFVSRSGVPVNQAEEPELPALIDVKGISWAFDFAKEVIGLVR
jgi:hypothetical protein